MLTAEHFSISSEIISRINEHISAFSPNLREDDYFAGDGVSVTFHLSSIGRQIEVTMPPRPPVFVD